MPGVWIDKIFNNSSAIWCLSSVDKEHNGGLYQNGVKVVELDGGTLHPIFPGEYSCQWCGVPWAADETQYKLLTKGGPGTKFFMAQEDGKNWVVFLDAKTGRKVGRVEVSMTADSRANLRLEDDGPYLDVYDAPTSTGSVQQTNDAGQWIVSTLGDLAKVLLPLIVSALA